MTSYELVFSSLLFNTIHHISQLLLSTLSSLLERFTTHFQSVTDPNDRKNIRGLLDETRGPTSPAGASVKLHRRGQSWQPIPMVVSPAPVFRDGQNPWTWASIQPPWLIAIDWPYLHDIVQASPQMNYIHTGWINALLSLLCLYWPSNFIWWPPVLVLWGKERSFSFHFLRTEHDLVYLSQTFFF